MANEYVIKSIIPTPVPMQAVYIDDDEEIIRRDIICLAVVYCYPELEKKEPARNLGMLGEGSAWNITTSAPIPDSYIRPFICEKDGNFIDAEWLDGFLGIETGGKELNWDEEIRELIGDAPDCKCLSCQKKKSVN